MLQPKRLWWIGLLLIGLLSACANSTAVAPTITSVPVDQSFQTQATGGSIAFQHPTGWAAKVVNGQIVLGNSQAALNATAPSGGQFVARMVVGPINTITNLNAQSSAEDVIQYFATSLATTGIKFTPPSDLRIGTYAAARVEGNSGDGQGSITAVNMNDGIYNIVSAVSATGEMSQFEPTLWAVLATVVYAPPTTDTPINAPAATAEPGG